MIVIVMGVAGSGKSTVGSLLARRLGWRFIEADDYHSRSEIEHMLEGQPLSDEERRPWLAKLRQVLADCVARNENAVLACSALKESYRRMLIVDPEAVRVVYLKGDPALIRQRLQRRIGHFAHENLLASQYAALEEPHDALIATIDDGPEQIVQRIIDGLDVQPAARA
jgi:gluconokinase